MRNPNSVHENNHIQQSDGHEHLHHLYAFCRLLKDSGGENDAPIHDEV
jgi:hypothetical protein